MNRSQDSAFPEPETAGQARRTGDRLISIADIRSLFKLGRTAAYELTHRPGFPDPVPISPRCYRWWASEVDAFAAVLRRERERGGSQRTTKPQIPHPATPRRLTGKVRAARTRKEAS